MHTGFSIMCSFRVNVSIIKNQVDSACTVYSKNIYTHSSNTILYTIKFKKYTFFFSFVRLPLQRKLNAKYFKITFLQRCKKYTHIAIEKIYYLAQIGKA